MKYLLNRSFFFFFGIIHHISKDILYLTHVVVKNPGLTAITNYLVSDVG